MTPRFVLFCLLGGLIFSVPALGTGHFMWWWISGMLVSASLLPVLRFGPRTALAKFGTILLVLVVIGTCCTLSEGILFFPEIRAQMLQAVVGGIVLDGLSAAVLVALGSALKLAEPSGERVAHPPAASTLLLVLVAGLSYVLYYEITGSITFHFFTRQYYPRAVEQVTAMGLWFPIYQWARGLAMTLAVLPVILSLRLPRWHAAIAVGLMVWIVGGGGPLLVPNTMMVAPQRYIHILEIMTQNVPLGITASLLLRRTPRPRIGVIPATA